MVWVLSPQFQLNDVITTCWRHSIEHGERRGKNLQQLHQALNWWWWAEGGGEGGLLRTQPCLMLSMCQTKHALHDIIITMMVHDDHHHSQTILSLVRCYQAQHALIDIIITTTITIVILTIVIMNIMIITILKPCAMLSSPARSNWQAVRIFHSLAALSTVGL